jgi:hypothetical protein
VPKKLSQMPVRKSPCLTCPFEGKEPAQLRNLADYERRCITLQSQHLCHSADNKMICRGGRNLVLRSLLAMGLITEPTDEAFDAVSRFYLGSNNEEHTKDHANRGRSKRGRAVSNQEANCADRRVTSTRKAEVK